MVCSSWMRTSSRRLCFCVHACLAMLNVFGSLQGWWWLSRRKQIDGTIELTSLTTNCIGRRSRQHGTAGPVAGRRNTNCMYRSQAAVLVTVSATLLLLLWLLLILLRLVVPPLTICTGLRLLLLILLRLVVHPLVSCNTLHNAQSLMQNHNWKGATGAD